MSIIPKETIEIIAQSLGITNTSHDVAPVLAPDVEYRIREIMQESVKCMRHSKRTVLTVDDVDSALVLRNVEPIYGFTFGKSLRFRRVAGHKDLFFVEDKEVGLKDVMETPLPAVPLDTSVACHWLAIEGIQPAIPENVPPRVISAPECSWSDDGNDALPVDIKLPVKHVLSRELQLYFDKVTELTLRESEDSLLFKEAMKSLCLDAGLHPLTPYFTFFIADEISRGLDDLRLLFSLLRVVSSLLSNPHVHIEPYLHQLMPCMVTCMVARRLGKGASENHWGLRRYAAGIVATICLRHGQVYTSLQTRLTKTLLNAFLDPKRSLTQHYGAVEGLAALGPNVIRHLILPNLGAYLRLLEPEMVVERQKNAVKRGEAWFVHGALLRAAGKCMYSWMKVFPVLPLSPFVAGTAPAIATTHKRKRREGPVTTTASAEAEDGGDGDAPFTRRGGMTALKKQIWKDELESGRLLFHMLDCFGEGISPFISTPQLLLFL